MAKILYSCGDNVSEEAESILKNTGNSFEIQPHLFSDTDEPVIRMENGELLIGIREIRSAFPMPPT